MKSKDLVPISACLLCGAIIFASISGEHIEHLAHSQYHPEPVGDIQVVGTTSLPSGYPGMINF